MPLGSGTPLLEMSRSRRYRRRWGTVESIIRLFVKWTSLGQLGSDSTGSFESSYLPSSSRGRGGTDFCTTSQVGRLTPPGVISFVAFRGFCPPGAYLKVFKILSLLRKHSFQMFPSLLMVYNSIQSRSVERIHSADLPIWIPTISVRCQMNIISVHITPRAYAVSTERLLNILISFDGCLSTRLVSKVRKYILASSILICGCFDTRFRCFVAFYTSGTIL